MAEKDASNLPAVSAPPARARRLFKRAPLSGRDRSVLARSILLEETSPPGLVYTVVWLVVVLILAFAVWSAIIHFDERASAPGEVLTEVAVTPIQHLEGGIVSELLVRDGERVEVGTPLMRLDPTAASAEFEGLRAREAALAMQIARLRATALGETPDFGSYAARFPDFVADQRLLFETQARAVEAATAAAEAQIRARREELRGLQAQEDSLEQALASLREEYDIRSGLAEQGLGRRTEELAAERRVIETDGALNRNRTEQARVLAAIAELEERKLEARETLTGRAYEQLTQLTAERAEVAERIRRLQDRYSRTELRAPIAGIVTGLKLAKGTVIAPGDTLMEIVPQNERVLAQVRISPMDIGYIKVGQPALVKIDSYSFARQGGVTGQVSRIAATSFQDREGRPYFEAEVSLDVDYVGTDPKANKLTPGMTLVADIKTGEKSLLEYLWRPVSHSLSEAFGER